VKLFEKQKEILREMRASECKILILEGAVRSGKTTLASKYVPLLLERCPVGDFVIAGVSLDTIKRNVVSNLINVFGDKFVKFVQGRREVYVAGRTFHCIGATDDRGEHKLRGMTIAGALVDETVLLPEPFFLTLINRMSLPRAQMIATTNPDNKFHWLNTKFIEPKLNSVKSWKLFLEDNPSLDQEYINTIKETSYGAFYKRAVEGEWANAEGLVFPDFCGDHVIGTHSPTRPVYYGAADYGTTNPCAFLCIAVDPHGWPRVLVEREYYFDSAKEGYKKTELEYVRDAAEFFAQFGLTRIFVDPKATSFITAMRKECPQFDTVGAENEVLPGILKIGNMLSTGELKINSRCVNLIREMNSYCWDERETAKGKDEPKKANDHAVDALRYFVNSVQIEGVGKKTSYGGTRIYSTSRPLHDAEPQVGFIGRNGIALTSFTY
jgi:PBSX family phage terminase large subunit